MTSIGLIWMGRNWYLAESASFIGMDALGHNGNRDDGYGVCRFSPLVDWDHDGRLGANSGQNPPPLSAALGAGTVLAPTPWVSEAEAANALADALGLGRSAL